MTRREFIVGSAALAAAPRAFAAGTGLPLRIGMISDVHFVVGDNGWSVQNCLCYEPALRYFDSRKADAVVVAGDLTDFGTLSGLRGVAAIWNSVFPGNRRSDGEPIVPIFIFGDHDMGGYMHKQSWAPKAEVESGVIPEGDISALWQECFGEAWEPIQLKTVKGVPFVLAHHPRHNAESAYGNQIPGLAEFLAEQSLNASKPFFLVQHRMFKNTVGGEENCRGWENGRTTEILKGYPNAIGLCGHGHRNAVDECCLWQGEFTAIEIPSLNFCCTRRGRENGYNNSDTGSEFIMPKAYITKSWQGMFGTLYADRFVVERRDFLNKLPLGTDWTIPLPSPDGSLCDEVRARNSAVPQFSPCAAVSLSEKTVLNKAGTSTDAVVVSFPVAHATPRTPRAFDYVVRASVADGTLIKEKYVFSHGQFWADIKDVKPVECAFAKADLPADWRNAVKFTAAPRDSFGNCGPSI